MEPLEVLCPLCESSSPSLGRSVPYERIWAELAGRGARFRDATRSANTPADDAIEARCRQCDLVFFVPLAPGDQSFYEELMADEPYLAYRWDFSVGASVVRPNHQLLDVGCGEGAFLRMVRRRAARVVGLDLNAPAVARLRAEGIEAHAGQLEDYATANTGRFDVVTSYQTLEHLGDARSFVRAAALCLRPGGSLVISVPNRDRRHREPFEVFDLPPHHVSHWGPAQLRELARQVGLSVDWVRVEPAGRFHARALYGPRVLPLEHIVGRRGLERVQRAAVAGSITLLRYFGDVAARRPAHRGGHSLVAQFRSPLGWQPAPGVRSRG